MSSRHLGAVIAGLALVVAPVGVQTAFAQTPPAATAPTAASLQAVISAAARQAAADPAFAGLTAQQKLTAIQTAVAAALAASGATPEVIQAALILAVTNGVISAGVAIAIAASISPEMAQAVANAPAVIAQLKATGQSATVTASTDGGPGVSVLVSLQGPTGAGPAPAAYDPCAGVIAAYCGS